MAVSERRSYVFSVSCAWALTIAVGAMTVAGVLAMFLRLGSPWDARLHALCVFAFAAVAGLALANANNAAAAAMHAMTRGKTWRDWHWPTLLPALVCAGGFCFASVIGVHLGWEIMTQGTAHRELPDPRQVLLAAAFLAFAKPAMSWVVEGRRAMDKADAEAAEAAEDARLDSIRRSELEARAANVTRIPPRVGRTAAAAVLALGAALGAPHQAADAAGQMQTEAKERAAAPMNAAPQTRAAKSSRRHGSARLGYEDRLARARQLLLADARESNRTIAKQTGLSASTIDRLARSMTPLAAV
ncbi:MAG: AsnC family protein [Hyphomonadaceae bacterium]|nr:AsnC family protein [Hyphomonadaceae bacterium]